MAVHQFQEMDLDESLVIESSFVFDNLNGDRLLFDSVVSSGYLSERTLTNSMLDLIPIIEQLSGADDIIVILIIVISSINVCLRRNHGLCYRIRPWFRGVS